MTDVVNLNEVRAEKEQDSRAWTPLEALKAAVRDIEEGRANPEKLVVHYLERKEDGRYKTKYYASGLLITEHIGLLEIAKQQTINEWVL